MRSFMGHPAQPMPAAVRGFDAVSQGVEGLGEST
jgi:hypothetical protein